MSESKMGVAFVSGGSKGIGLAVVQGLQRRGYQVITCGRSRENWQQALDHSPELADVEFHAIDLLQPQAITELFAQIRSCHGKLDVAVNNASPAIASAGAFNGVPAEALLNTLMADLWVPTQCLQQELQLMTTGAAIVNISSVNGLRPTPGAAMYSTAKHGLEGLTRSVALEAIEHGIRINAVAPGATWTPRSQQRMAGNSALKAQTEQAIPIKRLAQAEEIAAAVLWLLSDQASYVVGHTLVVDGGLALR
ncbi:SDR family NAD(P)-dependent oxidoreductase [Parachitinimonas caeni]|uniref:SDR family NAD(P)-dependent oxidoreductase n=1 Tax=Parachitinimonas caeni TaxID=3031301 RepID=A0ABT7DY17_9NEIS|nr:SDR family oxidoreductase [Parachitinimonas caeni]MDK2124940.1 SDR family NAD(P)-dependent oxidoreductase [Parachitinimonas caeni]